MSTENLEEHMRYHEAMGERVDAFSGTQAGGHYSDVKHEFAEAIRFAREAGRADEVSRLEQRLTHIQEVFRSQFS